jgi:hypothetical protein
VGKREKGGERREKGEGRREKGVLIEHIYIEMN